MKTIAGTLLMVVATAVVAVPVMPPHLGPAGQDEYREYQEAPDHRAFAIAPGGAWGWAAGKPSAEAAEEEALAICQGQTEQRCVSYAVDARTVFDAANWPKLWRPYASAAQSKRAKVGRERGMRMHDLAFTTAQGKPGRLSALRGKVVVLHFWGAWCPPCRREMPDLQKTYERLKKRGDFAFVILQSREKFEVSRQWVEKQGIALPLADSGSAGEQDANFKLADGSSVKDRDVANRFPTTYVLDRNGLVVFSHVGPIPEWSQYDEFLTDLAAFRMR